MVTRAEIFESTGDYWKTYQQFGYDEQRAFKRTSSMAQARMAASGVKSGSQQWKANLGKIESDYEKSLGTIKEGVTAGILEDWVTQQKKELSYVDRQDSDDDSYNYRASAAGYAREETPWYTEGLDERLSGLEKPEAPKGESAYGDDPYEQYERDVKQYERESTRITREYNKELSEMSTTEFLEKTYGLLETPGKEPTAEELSSSRAASAAGGRQQAAAAQQQGKTSPWW